MCIRDRLCHLVYQYGDVSYLELYLPSYFARQFDYDQLYIGYLNPRLGYVRSLIDDARAWGTSLPAARGPDFVCHTRLPISLQVWTSSSGTRYRTRLHLHIRLTLLRLNGSWPTWRGRQKIRNMENGSGYQALMNFWPRLAMKLQLWRARYSKGNRAWKRVLWNQYF